MRLHGISPLLIPRRLAMRASSHAASSNRAGRIGSFSRIHLHRRDLATNLAGVVAPDLSPKQCSAQRKPLRFLLIVSIVLAVTLGVVFTIRSGTKAAEARAETDRAMAAEVEQMVVDTLSRMSPDNPLIRRLGAFQQLLGTGYDRPNYAWQLVERVDMNRTAVFGRGRVPLGISIAHAGPLSVQMGIYPSNEWLAANPLAREIAPDAAWCAAHPEYSSLAGAGDLLVLLPNNAGASATTIQFDASHPGFTTR